ncbi:MAG: hemolysin III family protein [Leptospiraceae bacterium]|nr:hemolysin III family protein [Leptospiraceae bacterium]MCP5513476.1 hemolysin III family protein [Leptospiraceae bacterium]
MKRPQTPLEEFGNALIHGIGAFLGLIGWIYLATQAMGTNQATNKIISVSLFGFSLIALYLSSTLYHSSKTEKTKKFFKVLDHCSIYLLIAGSYSPFTLILLEGSSRYILLSLAWGLAVAGIVFKLYFTGRFKKTSTAIYILMGWMALFFYKPILEAIHYEGFAWIIGGGLSYTLGAIFYLWDRIPAFHTIWHIFVVGGSTLHFFAILFYVIPY